MILVDTSVWIAFLRPADSDAKRTLARLLEKNSELVLCAPVYQELLQGSRDATEFAKLQRYFGVRDFIGEEHNLVLIERAAQLYAKARWAGHTLRSSTDCVIAQIAIDFNIKLLHNDRDFLKISVIAPKLKHQHFLETSQ
jgi:predicted nucleic acid-binding protein